VAAGRTSTEVPEIDGKNDEIVVSLEKIRVLVSEVSRNEVERVVPLEKTGLPVLETPRKDDEMVEPVGSIADVVSETASDEEEVTTPGRISAVVPEDEEESDDTVKLLLPRLVVESARGTTGCIVVMGALIARTEDEADDNAVAFVLVGRGVAGRMTCDDEPKEREEIDSVPFLTGDEAGRTGILVVEVMIVLEDETNDVGDMVDDISVELGENYRELEHRSCRQFTVTLKRTGEADEMAVSEVAVETAKDVEEVIKDE